MAQNPPAGNPRIMARIAYDDAKAAIQFLTDAFGFVEREEERLENGGWILTELAVLDSAIMVSSAGPHGIVSPRNGDCTQGLIVYVDGIDAHFERAKAAGAVIVSEPEDQFWGDRRYEAKDPEGHLWSFHEHLRDVPREEWGI